ncbi:MAG: hypothetical protein QOK44_60 [Betaproteobacteria bacterium]|nr:hypothetical protein [Betaproteobacteria bacterium]
MLKIIFSAILLIAPHVHAASFDCAKRVTAVEKAICDDPALTQLDDQLAKAYEQVLDKVNDRTALVASQRIWLQQRDRCIDKRCLQRAYQDRLNDVKAIALTQTGDRLAPSPVRASDTLRGESAQSLERAATAPIPPATREPVRADPRHSERSQVAQAPTPRSESDELRPFRPSVPLADVAPQACAFTNLKLPEDFRILATGAYTGRRLGFQIDQSGQNATQFDVAVNSPDKPVVLILGAYDPAIWNIGWTPKTRIVAVLVSGYHRQAIAGLDPKVPTLNSTYDNKGACGYFYLSAQGAPEQLNPLARKLFGKPVDLVYPAAQGAAMVGERVVNVNDMVTHPATPPESFRNPSAPLAGPAGLEDGVRIGALRRATQSDAQAWGDAVAASTPQRDVPPIAGVGVPKPRPPSLHNGYVVLKQFTYPEGLYGAYGATFFIAKGAPRPTGNPGHSAIYDFNTLNCQGALCSAGR